MARCMAGANPAVRRGFAISTELSKTETRVATPASARARCASAFASASVNAPRWWLARASTGDSRSPPACLAQVRLVYVFDLRADRDDVLESKWARLVQQRREFLARGLAPLRADAHEVTTVNRPVWAALARHVERDDARAVVERDDVNEGEDRG